MNATLRRFAGLCAAVLFAATLSAGSASAGGDVQIDPNFVPENSYRHYGGFDCLYTCGNWRGGGCYSRCRQGGRHITNVYIYPTSPADEAMRRDYWKNSGDFKDERDRFGKDEATYRQQAEWYARCMRLRGRDCAPPEPPH